MDVIRGQQRSGLNELVCAELREVCLALTWVPRDSLAVLWDRYGKGLRDTWLKYASPSSSAEVQTSLSKHGKLPGNHCRCGMDADPE